ncbi:hypothetical protein [Paremcibacter congregatus]|uniref:hypothetical protein n=1 Tax=Paremcibacter congregatus TaxID=2043170 RepID=UPI003A91E424
MTKIEWTHREGTKGETWNPIRARNKETGGIGHFCTKVSAGCQNCYAADFQKRFKTRFGMPPKTRIRSNCSLMKTLCCNRCAGKNRARSLSAL